MSNDRKVDGLNRREFLKNGAVSALFLSSGALLTGCLPKDQKKSPGIARNVIFMVSDGMSIGALTSADLTMQRQFGKESHWMRLYRNNLCKRALMDVAIYGAIVPDSAASAAAWGSGYRVEPRKLNIGPNNEEYTPINTIFKNAGKSTGLVTTTRITHATPAGFTVNVDHRDKEDEIAMQYYQREHDVYLGGGYTHFNPEKREDGVDLIERFREKGYQVVKDKSQLRSVDSSGKLLGLFADSHLPYTIDRINTPELGAKVPTLSEMTQVALDRLNHNSNGFILQVEGGRVDHGAHSNDIAGVIYDQIEFDDAIGTVLDFVKDNPDTLVIITTDHGNASPTLNRSQNGYDASEIEFDRIQKFKHTNSWVLERLDARSSVNEIRSRVEEATEIQITTHQATTLQQALRGTYEALYHPMMSNPQATLGQILANYLSINWTGTNHTADYVELAAFGPGSEMIDGFIINTELFHVMLKATQIEVPA